ncbi:histone acetyltransferases subunit 3-domain-containing protein [Kalaharituber pfeilii]|nr:histone acetyltransferases subunit 3-domain-containing protein [Kalaharituber pfeilii]
MSAGKGKGKTRGGGGAPGGAAGSAAGGATSSKDSASQRRSRSRNTTPASTAVSEQTLMSGELSLSPQVSYGDILDKYVPAGDTSIPASITLTALASDLRALSSSAARQAAACRARIEELTGQVQRKQAEERERKEREDEEREKMERKRRDRDERRARDDGGERRKKKDKDRDKHHGHSKHPPTHGAHQLASQAPADAAVSGKSHTVLPIRTLGQEEGSPSPADEKPYKRSRSRSLSSSSSSSESERQPTPAPPVIVHDYFENDDTIYHIEAVTPETSVEERKRIYQVADFPRHDLTELQPGTPRIWTSLPRSPRTKLPMPPFAAYIEPYFRNFTEEDLAFLRERGDRVNCYVMPPLGRHYSEVWAEDETQTPASAAPAQPKNENQPKGGPDSIGDDVLEKDEVSLGPLMSRILAGMVVEDSANEQNGEANGEDEKNQLSSSTLPGFQDPSWKLANNAKSNYAAFEEAMKREMRYIGLWEPNEEDPDWSAQQDDEVSARLRVLQKELRKQSILNGARKTRLTEMLKDQLAYQEYATILEDLDKQVEQAYTKRTRNFKPKKKKVVPNGAGVAQARMGIGDQARMIMERRKRWKEIIGAVFEEDMTRIPKESIFNNLEELERIEEEGCPEEEA